MGAWNGGGIGLSYRPARRYFKILRSPGIDSASLSSLAGRSPYFYTFMEPRNRFQGINSASLCSLAGRYDNPIPTRCLAPIDFLKIPAPAFRYENPIPTQFLAPKYCFLKFQHRLHRLAELIPWNRFLGSLKV
jgi:hypothetical protein